jgi:hypothetical protein
MTDEKMEEFCQLICNFILIEADKYALDSEELMRAVSATVASLALDCAVDGHEADVLLEVIGMVQEVGVELIDMKRGGEDESSVQRHN